MLKNTIILFAAMIAAKLIGALLKIPLTNIIGGLGMGYFSTAHSLFSPIYAITAAGLPTVVMRMVAQNIALKKHRDVRRIRKAALIAAVGLGLFGSIGIFLIARPFSLYIAGSPNSFLPILMIAPSLFFCSVAAVYKGYYEGLSNMLPTAISQIIEAVIKSSVGIFLATFILARGGNVAHAAAAALAGITIAEFFGLTFLVLRGKFGEDGISTSELKDSPSPYRKRVLIKMLITQSLPVTIAALAMNLNPFIDMMTIPTIINATIANNAAFFRRTFVYGAYGGESVLNNIDNIGNFAYGSYTGIAIPIFALATTVTALVCKSALPEITNAWEQKDSVKLTTSLKGLFKGTFMVGLPICLGVAALAHPILTLLYFSRPAEVLISTPPLIALGIGGVPLLLSGTLFGIFLAIGRTDLQIKLMLLGAVVKFAGNVVLVRIPEIGITGAAISTILCYTLVSIMGLVLLKGCLKKAGITTYKRIKVFRNIAQPFVFALLCSITAYVCYYHVFFEYGNLIRLALSIATGGVVYLSLTMFADKNEVKRLLSFNRTKKCSVTPQGKPCTPLASLEKTDAERRGIHPNFQ